MYKKSISLGVYLPDRTMYGMTVYVFYGSAYKVI